MRSITGEASYYPSRRVFGVATSFFRIQSNLLICASVCGTQSFSLLFNPFTVSDGVSLGGKVISINTEKRTIKSFSVLYSSSPHRHDRPRSSFPLYHSSTLSLKWSTLDSSICYAEKRRTRLGWISSKVREHEVKARHQTASTRLDTSRIRRRSRG